MGDWKDVPLIGQPYETVEEMELDEWAATVVDAIPIIVEGKLHLIKRPGLTQWIDLGTNAPIDGCYWFDKQQCALVVSAGRVWKITDSAGTITELTGSTALVKSSSVTFADDGVRVAMANGANIVYTDLSTLTTAASNWPTRVTHVAYLDKYLLANNVGTGQCQFSVLGDITTCNAADYFEAESDPDNLVAMKVAYREVCLVGRQSVEFWVDDGTTPFSRIDGSAQPFGTEAPYSLAQIGGTWIWLDHTRRLATMQGRQVVNVSSPYDRVIQRMISVNDAVGYVVSIDGYPIYVLNFPTARQTLAYNYVTQQWHKWGYWDTTTANYQRYRGLSYCFARAWNTHLVGDYANGILYKADPLTYTDNGNPIRTLLRTGHISHGADFTKRSNIFRLKCKRGAGNAAVADPQIMLRRRINNKAQWHNERWKSLGQAGQHELFIDWRRNGIYKTCQYEIVHSDNSAFVITGAQENIDLLGR
jgi:hypothetical protein